MVALSTGTTRAVCVVLGVVELSEVLEMGVWLPEGRFVGCEDD